MIIDHCTSLVHSVGVAAMLKHVRILSYCSKYNENHPGENEQKFMLFITVIFQEALILK